MSTLTKAQRDKLPESDFGDPQRRLFPILDQNDVDSAARLIGKAADPEAVKRRIIAIAKRKNLSIPDAWKTADHSTGLMAVASFSGDTVRRRGKVWECGDFPDKDFSLTPEELLAAASDFAPVPVTIEHVQTVLDGSIGSMVAFEADGFDGLGELELPRWLSDVLPDPVPVSLSWDRETKRVSSIGIVVDPRIADAAVASFGAQHGEFHDSKRFKQKVHDLAASSGAVCQTAAMSSTPKEKSRMSKWGKELKAWFTAGMQGDPPEPEPEPEPTPEPQQPVPAQFAAQPDPRVATLEAEVKTLKAAKITADAAAFAAAEISANRAIPADHDDLVAEFTRAAIDDAAHPYVSFSADAAITSRVDEVKARHAKRTPHQLTTEMVGTGAQVLFNQQSTPAAGAPKPPSQESVDALLAMSPLGKAALNGRQQN